MIGLYIVVTFGLIAVGLAIQSGIIGRQLEIDNDPRDFTRTIDKLQVENNTDGSFPVGLVETKPGVVVVDDTTYWCSKGCSSGSVAYGTGFFENAGTGIVAGTVVGMGC